MLPREDARRAPDLGRGSLDYGWAAPSSGLITRGLCSSLACACAVRSHAPPLFSSRSLCAAVRPPAPRAAAFFFVSEML